MTPGAQSAARTRGVPGQPDMWAFVLFEALTFTAYFTAYMLYRMGEPALFLASQARLDQNFGVANTLVLLTSSLFMAQCVREVRAGRLAAARVHLRATGGFGLAFLALKAAEWSEKLHQGITLSTNLFFSFYYFLTAIHVFHVLVGFGVLTFVHQRLRDPGQDDLRLVRTGATYWHMVDFLWVFIFALLYVMR
jgi:nitric oxide reductase NorE protein